MILSNTSFQVSIDPMNGSIAEVSHRADPASMNWVTSAQNAPWQPSSFQWGLGYADTSIDALHRTYWERPESLEVDQTAGKAHVLYRIGALAIEVMRQLEGDAFSERYAFTNTGTTPLELVRSSSPEAALALYAPFNDNYTTTQDCLEHRAHTHLWCGESSTWACLLRMGGRGPHLGWVLTEGSIYAYSIAGRDRATLSNTRGLFLLHPAIQTLAPGETRAVAWTLFWHQGWEDFFSQCARRSPQFIRMEASRYTAFVGEEIAITAHGTSLRHPKLIAGGQSPPLEQEAGVWRATLRAETVGEVTCKLTDDSGLETHMALNICPALTDLIAARVRFIVERQQVEKTGDALEGAFLVYDNDCEAQVRNDWGSDRNEGRERLGMGVLLARWLRNQSVQDAKVRASLDAYYQFVSTRLQREDGSVLDCVIGKPRVRLYNWPWVMQLHLQMAQLTGSELALRRFIKTVDNFYANGGAKFYPIALPVLEGLAILKSLQLHEEYQHVLTLFSKHGEWVIATGTNYPSSEVNFEQAIIGPAATLLLELHRATGESQWLEAARPHLHLLELFNGRQPDHHLHEVAIRHWDGYWFGKAMMWGDTFPHYWSCITAMAVHHYGKSTSNADYLGRSAEIIRNNLSLFSPDGRASCAFIYPYTVNGQRAYFADPYANDQDWALAFALEIQQNQVDYPQRN